jgi:hypothetical protein
MDELRLQTPEITNIAVNFPFTIIVEHPVRDLAGMFLVTQAFDMWEMEKDPSEKGGTQVKEKILVDVLECTPTTTTVKVTPAFAMSYKDMALHTDVMMRTLSKRLFAGKAKVVKLTWEVDKTGVASDIRGMLRKVS